MNMVVTRFKEPLNRAYYADTDSSCLESFIFQDIPLLRHKYQKEVKPFLISKLPYRNGYLSFNTKLLLEPFYDEDGYINIINTKLNIDVYGNNEKELKDRLFKEIRFLWDEFAQENSENLSPEAVNLKNRLLSQIEYCTDAN